MANVTKSKIDDGKPSAQVRVSINPWLGMIPKELWGRQKDFFIYGCEFLPLTASLTLSSDIQIQADSDFLILGATAVVTDTGDLTIASVANGFDKFNPPFLATITDTGSGRSFMNTGISFRNLYGIGELPMLWPYPKLIQASSVLTTKLQNLVATDRRIRIAYMGIKIFQFLA